MGFAFLAYEDQRSTVLAIDNFNGIELCGRQISVDHISEFKIPRIKEKRKEKDDEESSNQAQNDSEKLYKPSGPDGLGWGEFREITQLDIDLLEQVQQEELKMKQQLQVEQQEEVGSHEAEFEGIASPNQQMKTKIELLEL